MPGRLSALADALIILFFLFFPLDYRNIHSFVHDEHVPPRILHVLITKMVDKELDIDGILLAVVGWDLEIKPLGIPEEQFEPAAFSRSACALSDAERREKVRELYCDAQCLRFLPSRGGLRLGLVCGHR